MPRYHVSADGVPRSCHAGEGACPLSEVDGSGTPHGDFTDDAAAQAFAEKVNLQRAEAAGGGTLTSHGKLASHGKDHLLKNSDGSVNLPAGEYVLVSADDLNDTADAVLSGHYGAPMSTGAMTIGSDTVGILTADYDTNNGYMGDIAVPKNRVGKFTDSEHAGIEFFVKAGETFKQYDDPDNSDMGIELNGKRYSISEAKSPSVRQIDDKAPQNLVDALDAVGYHEASFYVDSKTLEAKIMFAAEVDGEEINYENFSEMDQTPWELEEMIDNLPEAQKREYADYQLITFTREHITSSESAAE